MHLVFGNGSLSKCLDCNVEVTAFPWLSVTTKSDFNQQDVIYGAVDSTYSSE